MKLVKKILRLYPIIVLLYCLLLPMFTNLPFNVEDINISSFMDIFNGFHDVFMDNYYFIFAETPFVRLFEWFSSNITSSPFFIVPFGTLVYELFLSLMFLFFDFINMIFNWANKLIDKGANSVE